MSDTIVLPTLRSRREDMTASIGTNRRLVESRALGTTRESVGVSEGPQLLELFGTDVGALAVRLNLL